MKRYSWGDSGAEKEKQSKGKDTNNGRVGKLRDENGQKETEENMKEHD